MVDPLIMAGRWGGVAKELIARRDFLRLLGSDRAPLGDRDTDEMKECYRMAAAGIGPAIKEAVRQQRHFQKMYDDEHPKQPEIVPLTPSQLDQLGDEIDADETLHGMERQGRPLLNIEFSAIRKRDYRTRKQQCERFLNSYLDWLNEIALTAVAVRLEVPSLEMGVENV